VVAKEKRLLIGGFLKTALRIMLRLLICLPSVSDYYHRLKWLHWPNKHPMVGIIFTCMLTQQPTPQKAVALFIVTNSKSIFSKTVLMKFSICNTSKPTLRPVTRVHGVWSSYVA